MTDKQDKQHSNDKSDLKNDLNEKLTSTAKINTPYYNPIRTVRPPIYPGTPVDNGYCYSEFIPIERRYVEYVPDYWVDYKPIQRHYVDYKEIRHEIDYRPVPRVEYDYYPTKRSYPVSHYYGQRYLDDRYYVDLYPASYYPRERYLEDRDYADRNYSAYDGIRSSYYQPYSRYY